MSEVKAFKMLGGEEVVAEVVEYKHTNVLISGDHKSAGSLTGYVVRRPHILQFQPMGQGQLGLAFVPWTLSNPTIERLTIPKEAVLLTYDPSENVERQYIEQTSGIALAKPGQRISA